MKCAICKGKMQKIDAEVEFVYSNTGVKAINVPAFFCSSCNNTVIPDFINKRLQEYASLDKDGVIDFEKCIGKEAIDTIVASNLMWG